MAHFMAAFVGGALEGKMVKVDLVAGWTPSIGDTIEFGDDLVYSVVPSNGNRVIVDMLAKGEEPQCLALAMVHVPSGTPSVLVEESCGP